jgi:predicted alpha/beta hydrolase family esterase
MPSPDTPRINEWINKLNKIVKVNNETILIGHSIGCQTVLRFLEKLKEKQKIKAAILVAPWLTLQNLEEGEDEIAKEWVETPLNFEKIKRHCDTFVLIYSSTDPYPGFEDLTILRKSLGAVPVNIGDKGHINGEAGIFKLPELLGIIEEINE